MDTGLVGRSKRGDAGAFDALVAPLVERLHGVALRMLRDVDAADDATQDALVSAWRQLPKLRRADRFEPWLWRILVRSCYAESGRRRRSQARIQYLAPEPREHGDPFGDVDQRDALERAFGRLPEEQRGVLVLRHYLGFSSEEIADVMEIRPGTARTRLHYAHRAMRAALDADARSSLAHVATDSLRVVS
jgi:RNA polymerase sigma-70 factor (ECF subfamily)